MDTANGRRTEQRLLDASLVLLVAYNAVFIADVLTANAANGSTMWGSVMDFIDERRGWVTLFEAIAAACLFIDLVVRFDHYPLPRRHWRVAGIALAGAGFVFKAFTFYLNSSYLE